MTFADDKQEDKKDLVREIIANGNSSTYDALEHYSYSELLAIWALNELPDGTPVTPIT